MAKTNKRKRRLDHNNKVLRTIMDEYDLSRPEVADLARYGISMVDAWLMKPDSPHYRKVRDSSIRLIQLELGEAEPCGIPE